MRTPFIAIPTLIVTIASPVVAQQQQVGPLPFEYTTFDHSPRDDAELYWSKFFYAEPEINGQGQAFAAHVSIGRPDSRQEFAVFYSSRVCREIAHENGVSVSTCPARYIRFYKSGANSGPVQTQDLCIVHRDGQPPLPSDFAWNAAQVSFRATPSDARMVGSAVLNGRLLTECSITIPLNDSGNAGTSSNIQ